MRIELVSAECLPAAMDICKGDDRRSLRMIELNTMHRFDNYFSSTALFALTNPATPETVRLFDLIHYRPELHRFLFGNVLDHIVAKYLICDYTRKLARTVQIATNHYAELLQQRNRAGVET